MCVRHVCDLCVWPELLHVAAELEFFIPRMCEQAGIDGCEGAEEGRVRGVDREPELRHAFTPLEEVAPVAADRGEENAAGPHPKDGRNVLDQRIHAPAQACLRVEAEELLDRARVDRDRGPELVRREGNEEMDRQHGGTDPRSKLRASLDPAARLVVQAVDADERATRPSDRRLGRYGQLMEVYTYITHCLNGTVDGVLVRNVLRHQRDLDPPPVGAVEPLGELFSLGSRFKERYRVHCSRFGSDRVIPGRVACCLSQST